MMATNADIRKLKEANKSKVHKKYFQFNFTKRLSNFPTISYKVRKPNHLHFKKHKKANYIIAKKTPNTKQYSSIDFANKRKLINRQYRNNDLKTISIDMGELAKRSVEKPLDSINDKIRKMLRAKRQKKNNTNLDVNNLYAKRTFHSISKHDIVLPVGRRSSQDRENYVMRRTNLLDVEKNKRNVFYNSIFMNKALPIEINYLSIDGKKRTSYFCLSHSKPNKSLEVISLEFKKVKQHKSTIKPNRKLDESKNNEVIELKKTPNKEVNKMRTLCSYKKTLKTTFDSDKKLNNSDNDSIDSNNDDRILKPMFTKTYTD